MVHGETVSVVEFAMPADAAVIVVVPLVKVVTIPLDPVTLLTIAMSVSDELQLTAAVMSALCPSQYFPVAANCAVDLFGKTVLAGAKVIALMIGLILASVTGTLLKPPIRKCNLMEVLECNQMMARPFYRYLHPILQFHRKYHLSPFEMTKSLYWSSLLAMLCLALEWI
jgi:hypothetical protein